MHIKPSAKDEWKLLSQQIITSEDIYQNDKNNVAYTRYDNILIDLGSNSFSTTELCYPYFRAEHVSLGGKKSGCYIKGDKLIHWENVCKSIITVIANRKAKNQTNQTIIGFVQTVYRLLRVLKSQGRTFPDSLDGCRAYLSELLIGWKEEIKIYQQANPDTGQKRVGRSPNSVKHEQDHLLVLMVLHVNTTHSLLTQGMILIKKSEDSTRSTQPICFDELARQFNYFTSMFRAISNVILNDVSLPYAVSLYDAVNKHPYTIHLAPAARPICLEQESTRSHGDGLFVCWFNFETGQFYLPSVLIENGWTVWDNESGIRKIIKDKALQANCPFSSCRKALIRLALDCYFMHFLILTGLNDSTAATIEYGEYSITKSNTLGFSVIKNRSGHAEQVLELQTEFVDDFYLFVQVRNHLIRHEIESGNTVNDHKLFIMYKQAKLNRPTIMPLPEDGSACTTILRRNRNSFPFTMNRSRVLRTSKGRWIRKHFGIEVAAYVLDHASSTAMKSYTENDAVQTGEEFTNFYSELTEVALSINNEENETIAKDSAVGACTSNNKPDFVEATPDKLKQCNGEGCLFCRHYRLRATEGDVRKLLSLQFIIEESRSLAKTASHFELVFKLPLQRIKELLDELNILLPESSEMIEQLRGEVFEKERLSEFWLRKYNQMIDLGIL